MSPKDIPTVDDTLMISKARLTAESIALIEFLRDERELAPVQMVTVMGSCLTALIKDPEIRQEFIATLQRSWKQ